MVLFSAIAALVVAFSITVEACPPICVCFGISQGYRVDCTLQRLTGVPDGIPSNTTHLDLSDNRIDAIPKGIFDHLQSLVYLDLSKNVLKKVDDGVFANLTNLQTLRMVYTKINILRGHLLRGLSSLQLFEAYGSKIRVIRSDTFRSMSSLQTIDLSGNLLAVIDSHTFVGLQSLTKINLDRNRIAVLQMAAFMNLHNLTVLFLAGNRLTTVQQGTFIGVSKLRTVYLEENPFNCNCDILWLHRFVTERHLEDVLCRKPTKLHNRAFTDLKEIEICGGPEFYAQPMSTVYCEVGETAELLCGALGTPNPNIFWSFDSKPILNSPRFEVRPSGDLVIFNTTYDDSGTYYCTAASQAGAIVAQGQLIVGDVPRLNDSFSGLTGRLLEVGVTVDQPTLLRCPLTANPEPTYSWNYRGFPIDPDGGRKITTCGGVLIVTSVEADDVGRYTCIARNSIGAATQTFYLTLNEPPRVFAPLRDGWYSEGADVTLACAVRGFPEPAVTWYRNGIELTYENASSTPTTSSMTAPSPTLPSTPLSSPNTSESENATTMSKPTPTSMPLVAPSNVAKMSEPENATMMSKHATPLVVPPTNCTSTINGTLPDNCTTANITQMPEPENATMTVTSKPTSTTLPSISSRSLLENNVLLIQNIQRSDSGRYECRAVNSVSMTASSSYILVGDFGYPLVVVDPTTVTTFDGSTAVLHCNATGYPDPKISWSFRSRTFSQFSTGSRIFVSPSNDLVITKATLDDDGDYECRATNTAGVSAKAVRLLIYSSPRFIRHTDDTTVSESDTIRLVCIFDWTTRPVPILRWSVNGVPLPSTDFPRHQLSADNRFLVLDNARLSDAGFYTCAAKNLAGTATHTFRLSIYVPFQLTVLPSDVTVYWEAAAVFRCDAQGTPEPKIQWLRHGTPVDAESPSYVIQNGTFVILKAGRSDEGLYTCVATSGSRNTSAEARLTILVPPIFVTIPKDMSIKKGLNALLECRTDGFPQPTVTWEKDGLPLTLGPRFQISSGGSRLQISRLEIDDNGTYTCTASNGHVLNPYADIRLTVYQKARISSTDKSVPAAVGGSVRIECDARGFPSPKIEWAYDLMPLPATRFYTATDGSLIILDIQEFDGGNLECSAENSFGMDFIKVSLVVSRDRPVFPVISGCPRPVRVPIQLPAEFRCQATGMPKPTIRWLHRGVEVRNGEMGFNVTDDGALMIEKTSAKHEGEITCIAENSQGRDQFSTSLVVTRPPLFLKYPASTPQRVGRTVVLNCRFDGSPEPAVIWSRGNGSAISYDSGRHFQLADGSLLIANLRLGDAGEYRCEGGNGIANVGFSTYLSVDGDVDFPVDRLEWVDLLENATIIVAGESGVFSCAVASYPAPSFVWQFDGMTLDVEGDWYFITANGTLVIPDASAAASGTYSCTVSNGLRLLSQTFNVTVYVKPSIDEAPESKSLPWTDFASGHKPAELRCRAGGIPKPTIFWQKGQVMLRSDPRFFVTSEGSLVIDPLLFNDDGDYTCIALNVAGVATAKATILIHDDRPRAACNSLVIYRYLKYDNCRSKVMIDNVKCEGFCFSETNPDHLDPATGSRRFCCRPHELIRRDIEMMCDNGTEKLVNVETIKTCRCAACMENESGNLPPGSSSSP